MSGYQEEKKIEESASPRGERSEDSPPKKIEQSEPQDEAMEYTTDQKEQLPTLPKGVSPKLGCQ